MYYTHVTKPSGTNAPGVSKELYVAPISWFATIQSPSNAGTVIGDTITTSTAHTFTVVSPLKGFVRFYTTHKTAKANLKMVGELDSQGVQGMYEAWSPGVNIQLLEMMSQADEFMIMIPDGDCSVTRYIQMGDRCNPAYMKDWEWDSGQAGGQGKRGMKIMFDAYNVKPLIHTGTLQIAAQS